jgi:hypothetical protein
MILVLTHIIKIIHLLQCYLSYEIAALPTVARNDNIAVIVRHAVPWQSQSSLSLRGAQRRGNLNSEDISSTFRWNSNNIELLGNCQ